MPRRVLVWCGVGAVGRSRSQDSRTQGQVSWHGQGRNVPVPKDGKLTRPRGKLILVYVSNDMAGLVRPGRDGAGSGGRVEEAVYHVSHLLHAVFDVLLGVLGEGHAAVPDEALRLGGGPAHPCSTSV